MRRYAPANRFILSILLLIVITAFHPPVNSLSLTGAWIYQEGNRDESISFVDGYFVHAVYDKAGKQFFYTWGGPYELSDDKISITIQFHSKQRERIGEKVTIPWTESGLQLVAAIDGTEHTWKQLDKGLGDLAGVWRSAGRKMANQPVIRPMAARRTLKILTGTRFQWAAINVETGEFSGTGGGSYSLKNGQYTEHIEFFSRDSSRVGASLTFSAKLQDNGREWDHTGKSTKGDPVDEMWRKLNAE